MVVEESNQAESVFIWFSPGIFYHGKKRIRIIFENDETKISTILQTTPINIPSGILNGTNIDLILCNFSWTDRT